MTIAGLVSEINSGFIIMITSGIAEDSSLVSSINKVSPDIIQGKQSMANPLVAKSIDSLSARRTLTDPHSASDIKSRNISLTKPRPIRKRGFYEAFPEEFPKAFNGARQQGERTVSNSNWTGYKDVADAGVADAGVADAGVADAGNDGILGAFYHTCYRYISGQITDDRDYEQLFIAGVIHTDEFVRKVTYKPSEIEPNLFNKFLCVRSNYFASIPEDLKTDKLCRMALDINYRNFSYIPERFKAEELCEQVVIANIDCLALTTDDFKDKREDLRSRFVDEGVHNHKLSVLPKYSITYQQCYDALKRADFDALSYCPDKLKDARICNLACQKNGIYLQSVPHRLITDDLCRLAVSRNPNALGFVPYEMRTEELCEIYFNKTLELKEIPVQMIKEGYCKEILAKNEADQFIYIPKCFRTEMMYKSFLKHLKDMDAFYLFEKMPADFFDDLLAPLILHWQQNPDFFGDKELTEKVIYLIQTEALSRSYTREQGSKYQPLLELIEKKSRTLPLNQSYRILKSCIVCPALDKDFKLAFLQRFNQLVDNVPPHLSECDTLINTANPLQRSVINKCLGELAELAFKARKFRLPEADQGLALVRYIEDELEKNPDFEYPSKEPGFDTDTACQGRTLIVTETQSTFYYKLQRKGEDPSKLASECLIHKFLANGKASRLGLESEIPTAVGLYKLPVGQIPQELLQQLEALEIQTDGQTTYVLCYCYSLSQDYRKYAWLVDVASSDPHSNPEEGMIKTCHDLGRWCAMSILHTSTLPAFHDTKSERRWVPLQSVLGSPWQDHLGMCGTFGAWDTAATERPDSRYSGLADLVDYELFGSVESYFTFKDLDMNWAPPETLQRLALANYIIEVLLGNILLYARLHKANDRGYRIEQPGSIEHLAQFIERAAEAFLRGFTRSYAGSPPKLREVLNLSEESNGYQQWLQRTATEIIYWTSVRPDGRNFARDLGPNGPGHLDKELYTEPSEDQKKYPGDFHNCHGHLNLGANNCSFPLLSLMQGLTRLSSAILCIGGSGERVQSTKQSTVVGQTCYSDCRSR